MGKEKENKTKAMLQEELEHCRKQLAGAKGRNKQLAEQMQELKRQALHYKGLDKEGDELNEKRLSEIEEKDEIIKRLRAEVNMKNKEILKKSTLIEELREDLAHARMELVKYKQLPWYKKIFKKS